MCIFTTGLLSFYTGFFLETTVLLVENAELPDAGNAHITLSIYKKSKRRKTLKTIFALHQCKNINPIIDSLDKL